MKQYIVELTSEERSQLQQIVAKGNTTGYRAPTGLRDRALCLVSLQAVVLSTSITASS